MQDLDNVDQCPGIDPNTGNSFVSNCTVTTTGRSVQVSSTLSIPWAGNEHSTQLLCDLIKNRSSIKNKQEQQQQQKAVATSTKPVVAPSTTKISSCSCIINKKQ